MKLPTHAALWVALLYCAVATLPARADSKQFPTTRPATSSVANDEQFMRFVEGANGGGKLQTAVVTYKNKEGVTVDLIAAVHVGEKTYYEGLNKQFSNYDALLYEMVMPKGSLPPAPGQKSRSAVGVFQRFLKDALDLDYQLDDIDYTMPNFVHADLDAETFSDMQSDRGESIFGLMFRSMLREMQREADGKSRASQMTIFDLMIAMQAPDRPRQLKLLLARQFNDIEDQMAGLEGPDGSVIITERNKKCLSILKKSIADGKDHLGIFYGAAHMHDLSQRLETLGFHKTASAWRVSWDMTVAATQPATRLTEPVR